eukprot:403349862
MKLKLDQTIITLLLVTAYIAGFVGSKDDWTKDMKGFQATSIQQIQKYANTREGGSGQGAVFVSFYQVGCPYCIKEYPIWNKVVDSMKSKFGNQVTFVKVDIHKASAMYSQYGVTHTPFVAFLGKGANNAGWGEFREAPRTMEIMQKWMTAQMKKYSSSNNKNLNQNSDTVISRRDALNQILKKI